MRNLFKVILCLSLPLLSMSCQNKKEEELLALTITPKETYVVPSTIESCTDRANGTGEKSITSPYVRYRNFTLQWLSTTDSLSLIYIKMIFSGGSLSGDHECLLAGEDLDNTLGAANIDIAAGDNAVKTATCELRCGGFGFANKELPGYLSGRVRVLGIRTLPDGTERSVTAELDISAVYEGE